ncbi:MAG: SDR family oxidoreductase [Caldilinea sp.]|jgi:3-oxoacyl-[acyl-carrier protein] reductase
MQIDLSGHVAVVSGASRPAGIGAAIARRLAGAGADLLVTSFPPYDQQISRLGGSPHAVDELVDELRQLGVRAAGWVADLSQPQAPEAILAAAHRWLGPPSILVNNACHSEAGGLDELDASQLDRHYAVNVRGTVLMCQAFVRQWQRRRGGRIISLTSGQGAGPMVGELAYVVTKAAVDALTVTLAKELAGRGITVNAVDPGATDTGWMSAALCHSIAGETYLHRVGQPDDAARLVCFLASEQAEWITGQILRSRGGG